MAKGRREVLDEEEQGEGWLASYADMITDLLAVFVILFSFAMANQAVVAYKARINEEATITAEELEEKMAAGQVSFAEPPEASAYPGYEHPTPTPGPTPAPPRNGAEPTQKSERGALSPEEGIEGLYEAIRDYIGESGLTEQLNVIKESENIILVRVRSSVFFEAGSADISPHAEPVLENVGKILVRYERYMRMFGIEGHTDDRPIQTTQFDSNWELSTSRAVNVLRRMQEISGLDPSRFSAVGYGEFHPIADNATESGRAQNRRVDFIIQTMTADEYKQSRSAG